MPITADHITTLVEPVLRAAGYDLEEVTVTPGTAQPEVTVVVDRDGGADLDALAELTRQVSDLLDTDPTLGEDPFLLEVTSPGIDRPLTAPRHWRRGQGRKVRVEFSDGETARTLTGRIGVLDESAEPVTVRIVTNDRGRVGATDVALADVIEAVVEADFSRPSVGELQRCGLDDAEIARRRSDQGTSVN